MEPSEVRDSAMQLGAVVALVYGLLRFIFEPRLVQLINTAIKHKLAPAHESIAALEEQMAKNERKADKTETAIASVAESINRITKMMEVVTDDVAQQGRHLSFLAGQGEQRLRPRTSGKSGE